MDTNPTNTNTNNTQDSNNTGNQTPVSFEQNFDPTKDIDLSHIDIIDTSKGDSIDFGSVAYNQVFAFKCLNCNFKYEGRVELDKCPRCGSDKIDDSM
jgi:hypothetical protein